MKVAGKMTSLMDLVSILFLTGKYIPATLIKESQLAMDNGLMLMEGYITALGLMERS